MARSVAEDAITPGIRNPDGTLKRPRTIGRFTFMHRPMTTRIPAQTAFSAVLALPFGKFGIRIADETISELIFLPPETPLIPANTALAIAVAERINAWIEHPRIVLELPLSNRGTAFQQRVWQALRAIPAGEVRTYGELARTLGTAPRALGQACGANPFPLVVPCHRAVGAKGIGGFAHASDGYLIAAKRWLLDNEAKPANEMHSTKHAQ